jgi:hypothetical protein
MADIKDKIDHVLAEARMILPGAQAFFGFQFSICLTDAFAKLDTAAKDVHFASLALMCVCIVLLMTPPSYHRIVENGECTDGFHAFASRFVLAAMVFLALSTSTDVYVLFFKVTESAKLAGWTAGGVLFLFAAGWFGLPFLFHRE